MKKFAVTLACCLGFAVQAQIPAGYPADYAATVAAAEKEGKVVVYSSTDSTSTKPLLADFQALYPKIKVEYHDMNTTEIYSRFISENAANAGTADVLWSSSMDLQVKLVSDGYAMSYTSPESAKLPDWALWKNEAYGTTFEPIVFVYNKRLLQADEIPLTHADFTRILGAKADRFRNKVTSYDVEKSGLGFMLVTQDAMVSGAFWDLAKAMGAVSARYQSSTGTMMERIASGENLLGYNLLGAYAFIKAKKEPAIGIVYPKDYTLVISRVMFVAKKARNPNAAKLWLDYILSRRGQTVMANQADLFALRADVEGETTAAGLTKQLGAALKPVRIGPELLNMLDPAKRLEFLKQWQQTAVAKK